MNRAIAIVGILALVGLNLLLMQLSPLDGPLVILAVLASGYLCSLAIIYFILLLWFGFWNKLRRGIAHAPQPTGQPRRVLLVSLVLAFVPVLALLLRAQPNGRFWTIPLAILAFGGCFLLWRKKPRQKTEN